jgi:hypothetical protein
MKKFLVIACYNDYRQRHFEEYHSPRNKMYCTYHNFEYIEITDIEKIPQNCRQRSMVWWRFFLIKHWIDTGFLKDGDIISQIDADICIVNGEKAFKPAKDKSFVYAIDSCNTHCMGAFSLRITDWSKRMLTNLLDENRYIKYRKTPFWEMFQEQACWYSLAGILGTFAHPGQAGWNTVRHLGWNSTDESDPVYSLEELYANVEILPVEWNVTDWDKRSPYFRFPTKTNREEDVIFRHFAGGQKWDSRWAQIPLIKDYEFN